MRGVFASPALVLLAVVGALLLPATGTAQFAAEVKARGIYVPWAIMARADNMDREVLEALKG